MVITIDDLRAGRVDFSEVVDSEGVPVGPIHPARSCGTGWPKKGSVPMRSPRR